MAYEKSHTCTDCGISFVARTHNKVRCNDCFAEKERIRRRIKLADVQCTVCGKVFTPYKSGQVTCGSQRCKQDRLNSQRRLTPQDEDYNETARERRTRERTEQMNKLFRYYRSNDDILIDDVPDGTRVLITGDHQIPFVDESFEAAKQRFIDDWKPGIIILNGDIIDCYEISDYDQRPGRLFNLQDEMDMAVNLVNTYRRLSGGKVYWIDGNHEERVTRAIWRRTQEISFMVSDHAEYMELDRITDGFVPYGNGVEICGFLVLHGTISRKHSAYTAKAMMEDNRTSGANGHTHRIGSHSKTDHRGRSHTWYETGCSCRLDMEYMKKTPDWQHGFLIGEVYDNALHPTLIRVIESESGRGFVAGGKHYRI